MLKIPVRYHWTCQDYSLGTQMRLEMQLYHICIIRGDPGPLKVWVDIFGNVWEQVGDDNHESFNFVYCAPLPGVDWDGKLVFYDSCFPDPITGNLHNVGHLPKDYFMDSMVFNPQDHKLYYLE